MSPTLLDIAREAGVSVATASRVLNGSTREVRSALRTRVLTVAEQLGYVPNAHAQALVRATTSTVGVIVHDVSDPYFAEITRGIQRVASAAGRLVMICNSYRDPERELAYLTLLRGQRVEALILAGSGLDDWAYSQSLAAQVEGFRASGGRIAFIGRHNVPGDAVIPDNVSGARELGRALIALGHTRIGVISGPALLTTTRDRLDGFRGALREAGLQLPPSHVVEGDFSRDGGAAAAALLLERAPEITAIFALNDPMAIGALATLRARSIRVPEQISIAGFDDIAQASDVTPALTTVRLPMVELGVRAMELANADPSSELRVEHLPTELIVRDSTGPRS